MNQETKRRRDAWYVYLCLLAGVIFVTDILFLVSF